jgi:signal transduction histidine kinase
MLPFVTYYSLSIQSFMINSVFAFVPLMLVVIIAFEQKWRQTQRRILEQRELEHQVYMSQIFRAQENERQRIAQELHDGAMQELLVVANYAQTLVSNGTGEASPEVRERAGWIRDAILRVLEDMRRLSLDLRPSVLDNLGLIPALRCLVDRLNYEGGIKTRVVVHGTERKLNSETEVTIFRIVQEALNNVRRHSKATEAEVILEFAPESLEIRVQDNGKGFSLNEIIGELAASGKLGLLGMQERAKFLNSTFNIYSEPGKGTLVSIKIVD